MPAGVNMVTSELRDHAQEMLTALVADMERGQTVAEQAKKSMGQGAAHALAASGHLHADARIRHGFTHAQLLAEFQGTSCLSPCAGSVVVLEWGRHAACSEGLRGRGRRASVLVWRPQAESARRLERHPLQRVAPPGVRSCGPGATHGRCASHDGRGVEGDSYAPSPAVVEPAAAEKQDEENDDEQSMWCPCGHSRTPAEHPLLSKSEAPTCRCLCV
jgi:hypothetical protein